MKPPSAVCDLTASGEGTNVHDPPAGASACLSVLLRPFIADAGMDHAITSIEKAIWQIGPDGLAALVI